MDTMHMTDAAHTPGTVSAEYILVPAEWGDAEYTNSTVTAVSLALPDSYHPVWTMGRLHVDVAYAVCCAFFALGNRSQSE